MSSSWRAHHIWGSRRKRAQHLRSDLPARRVSFQLAGIGTSLSLQLCVDESLTPSASTRSRWFRFAEPLVSCGSIWMLDPGAASFPTGWARCPAITGYKWQIHVCVTSVHRSRGCMGDERSRQTSAWSARETRQPPGTIMGKTSRSNSTSCADGSQQAHNTFWLVDIQGQMS